MPHLSTHTTARRLRGLRLLILIGVAVTALVMASVASAATGTFRVINGSSPSLGHDVTVQAPGGGTYPADPGRALTRLTPSGGAAVQASAWCVDYLHTYAEGVDYTVNVQTPADTPALTTPAYQAAGWLMGRADSLIAAAASPGREAAAIQIAIWRITGQAANVTNVTNDSALNTRAQQLYDLAQGRSLTTSLSIAGPITPVVTGVPATFTVTATPGAVVDLSVTTGSATLSASQITIGPGGTGTVDVTASNIGALSVTATAAGGNLIRVAHLAGTTAPQDMAIVLPTTLTAAANVTAIAPAAVSGPTPTAVGGPTTNSRPVLGLTKTAPAKVRHGYGIPYIITVTNRGKAIARNVVIRDPVPAGTFVRSLPKGAHLVKGALVWKVGTLKPGQHMTVGVKLGVLGATLGPVRNTATASASNAATVRASARTKITLPTRVKPAVVTPVTG